MKEYVIIDIVYHGLKGVKEAEIDQYMFKKYLKENFPNFIVEDGKHPNEFRTIIKSSRCFNAMDVYIAFLLAFEFSDNSFYFISTDRKLFPSTDRIIEIIKEKWPEKFEENE